MWHLFRYAVATCVSTTISAIVPFLIASLPLVLAALWILIWIAAFLLYILTGEAVDFDADPIGIVLIPLMLSIIGVASVSAILLVVTAFNILIVFPFSFVTEIVSQRLGVYRWSLRPIIFLGAGVFVGVITSLVGIVLMAGQQTEIPLLHQLGVVVFLMLICVCTVFAFGMTLIIMDLSKKGFAVIRMKRLRRHQPFKHPT